MQHQHLTRRLKKGHSNIFFSGIRRKRRRKEETCMNTFPTSLFYYIDSRMYDIVKFYFVRLRVEGLEEQRVVLWKRSLLIQLRKRV